MSKNEKIDVRGLWFDSTWYPKLFLLSAIFCAVFFTVGTVYTPQVMFPETDKRIVFFLYAFALISFLLCELFYIMRKMYAQLRFFYISDRENIPPENCFTFAFAFKYIKCRLLTLYYVTLWNILFFSPSAICFFITVYLINEPDGMLKSIFFTLLVLTVLLFVAGCIFSFVVNGRFFLVTYLLYANPLEQTAEIIASSVLLTRNKLLSLALKRLLIKLGNIFSFIPYVNVALKIKKAEMCKKTYSS